VQGPNRFSDSEVPSANAFQISEHFVHRRLSGALNDHAHEELVEGLPRGGCALSQYLTRIVRYVPK
jgi:hypothetical protein